MLTDRFQRMECDRGEPNVRQLYLKVSSDEIGVAEQRAFMPRLCDSNSSDPRHTTAALGSAATAALSNPSHLRLLSHLVPDLRLALVHCDACLNPQSFF